MKKILVKKLSNGNYRVNNKILYVDLEGAIISITELTTEEKDAFYKFIGHKKPETLI
jgi:hypothetical protein